MSAGLSAARDVEGYVQLSDAEAAIRDHLLIDAWPSGTRPARPSSWSAPQA
ncbi:MAG: hypothetical protein L6367_16315 [Cellulomonas sp.]|nr:hypothetical protein [Cellulomonas sp.]